jgi:hypothetical protein
VTLIAAEHDDEALLRIEDEAIIQASSTEERVRTALDDLTELLNGVHPATEGDSGPRSGHDQSQGGF